jgi:hypothetical protein
VIFLVCSKLLVSIGFNGNIVSSIKNEAMARLQKIYFAMLCIMLILKQGGGRAMLFILLMTIVIISLWRLNKSKSDLMGYASFKRCLYTAF